MAISKSGSAPSATLFAAAAALVGIAAAGSVEAQVIGTPPQPEGRAALEAGAALNFSDQGLVADVHEDGRINVNLQGRFKQKLIAHVGPDGKLHMRCTGDHAHDDVEGPEEQR